MTDYNLTQIAVEQWASTPSQLWVTQIALEEWSSVTSDSVQFIVTQMAVEQWATVVAASTASGASIMIMA